MDEDNLLTIIFASLGIIMVVTSISFLFPKSGLTGFAISTPLINPIYLLTIPVLVGALFLIFKTPLSQRNPIQEYISNSRKSGMSELQIKNNLTEVGWKESDFKKFLK